jgi:inosose dehydratase
MSRFRLGNAPCSWGTLEFEQTGGSQKEVPFERMLDELVETGYTGTELGDWGYMPTDPSALRAELIRRNLVMLGGFVPVELKNPAAYEQGLADVLRVARLLAAVATEPKPYLVLADNNGSAPERVAEAGRITRQAQLSPAEWTIFAGNANELAAEVWRQTGLRTVFHHHCAGYVETPDEIARLLDLTDPTLIGLVFDTGHYAYGSGNLNVIEGLDRFQERIWYVHAKDCSASVAARARTDNWDYFQALKHGIFSELGKGNVDFSAVLRWLNDHSYEGFLLIEQDILPGMGTPKESARRNLEYLVNVWADIETGQADSVSAENDRMLNV